MKKRNTGLDLLKILCMLMILFMHFTSRETLQSNYNISTVNYLIVRFIDSFACVAVNCYFLITGYFLVDKPLKLNKVFKIWKTVLFYTVTIWIVAIVLFNKGITLHNTIKSMFPIITEHYWFITVYIAMLFLAPILKVFLVNMSKKQYQYLLIILTIILTIIGNIYPRSVVFNDITGINFITMLYVYIIGGYIKLHCSQVKTQKRKYLLGYIICGIITFIYSIITNSLASKNMIYQVYARKDMAYNSIWVVISSIMIFMYFKELKINSNLIQKIVNTIHPLSLTVYIIHENIFLKGLTLNAYQYQQSLMYILYILLCLVAIYIVCCTIEYIRVKLCKIIFKNKKVSKTEKIIEEKLNNILRIEL